MYALFPLLLIFVSFVVIIFLIVRKFPQLTLLDVENIPEVKEEKKKDEFLKKRAEKKSEQTKVKKKEKLEPIVQMSRQVQTSFRKFVGQVEKKVFHQTFARVKQKTEKKKEQGVSAGDEIQRLLREASDAFEAKNLELAEKKYIEVIRLDAKSVEAYRGLADVYLGLGQTREAEETYKFVHHLDANDEVTLVKLAELAEERDDVAGAIGYYEKVVLLNDSHSGRFAKLATLLHEEKQYPAALEAMMQAVELEPQNPKYLDNIIELAIMVGNKELAEDSYKKLRLVNPDNQKLPILKEKIDALK